MELEKFKSIQLRNYHPSFPLDNIIDGTFHHRQPPISKKSLFYLLKLVWRKFGLRSFILGQSHLVIKNIV